MTTDSDRRPPENESFEALLEFLKRSRGFDFTGYKRSTLLRRTQKRMQALGIESHEEYMDRLEVDPGEFKELFDTILINVTSFFRDRDAWDALARRVLPASLAERPDGQGFRVWCAGAASGEETFTTAMVLAETLGLDGFRDRVKIYATDVDDDALAEARAGVYPAKALEAVPEELRERYFESDSGRYTFSQDLRRVVIFGRHDLVQDAPISRVDLLVCRNTLMYFNAELQKRVLANFHFAMKETGILFLGKSEMMMTRTDLFEPIDLKRRLFKKVPKAVPLRDRLAVPEPALLASEGASDLLRDAGFETAPTAQIVLDGEGRVALANQEARRLFNLAPADVGRLVQDLPLSYRPLELRSRLEEAHAKGARVTAGDIPWGNGDDVRYFDVEILPLAQEEGRIAGASVTFTDVTRFKELRDELDTSRHQLESAYEELQSTVEELETTNEELQSTNEELETTNEELQSTNEELETMNEELQSTNEELETTNDELRIRTSELNQSNYFLESILASLQIGVAVVDGDLSVRLWNRKAEDLWGLRGDEVRGEHLLNLDIGLPLDTLRPDFRAALRAREEREVKVAATNRRGRGIDCLVRVLPLGGDASHADGAVVLMQELPPAGADGG